MYKHNIDYSNRRVINSAGLIGNVKELILTRN